MNAKKNRAHLQGYSNKDFRHLSKDKINNPNTNIIENLSIPKCKYRQILKNLRQNQKETFKDPITETIVKYKSINKNLKNNEKKVIKEWAKLSLPKINQIEEDKEIIIKDIKTDKNIRKLNHPKESGNYFRNNFLKKNNKTENLISKELLEKKKINRKKNEHAEAQIETQQVSLPQFLKKTLEGKINIDKVKEVKRALHRRYGNSKNLQKIFNSWDFNKKGMISIDDLYNMLNKMGLKMNKEECKILMSISDKDNNENLTIDEFYELIHDQDFNILNNINVINALIENEKNPQEKETFNKIKKFIEIKKKLKNDYIEIKKQLPLMDEKKKGFINKTDFNFFIKKLNLDENKLNKEEIDILFNSHCDDKGFNYKTFLIDLCNFNFINEETFFSKLYKGKDKNIMDSVLKNINKKNNDEKFSKVSHLNMNLNIILNNYNKIEYLRRKNNNIKKFVKINDLVKDKNELLSFSEVKEILNNYYKLVNINFRKKDKELLLGMLDFNKYDQINKNQLEIVFEKETELEMLERVNLRNKGPLNYLKEKDKLKEDIEFKKYLTIDFDKNKIPNLSKALKKIDNNILLNNKSFYSLFKQYDYNKDGFIDKNDIYNRLYDLNILNKNEINLVLNYFVKLNDNKDNFKYDAFQKLIVENGELKKIENYDKKINKFLSNNRESFMNYIRSKKNELKPENNFSYLIRIKKKFKIY